MVNKRWERSTAMKWNLECYIKADIKSYNL